MSTTEPAVSPNELAGRIRAECTKRGVTLEQFEDAVGWRLSECIEPPARMLEDMSLDGLQWLCREPDQAMLLDQLKLQLPPQAPPQITSNGSLLPPH